MRDLQLDNWSTCYGNIISDETITYDGEVIRVIIYNKNYFDTTNKKLTTRVILSDSNIGFITGTTYNKGNDKYIKEIGVNIAYLKAKNKQDAKIIKQLNKNINKRRNRLKSMSNPFNIAFYELIQDVLNPIIPSNIDCKNLFKVEED